MELVPIIWNVLLWGSALLLLILIVSYIASKLKKETPYSSGEIELIPDRPVFVTRQHENPKIQVTSSKLEKQYIQEKQPMIFDINRQKNGKNNSSRNKQAKTNAKVNRSDSSGTHYGGSIHRNPRFTILNDTMMPIGKHQTQVNLGDPLRFSDTHFI